MRIHFKQKRPDGLEKSDNISATRTLYIDQQEAVPITFVMESLQDWKLFNQLSSRILPPLPDGYQWVKANDKYSIIRNKTSAKHEIKLILYGKKGVDYINFLCVIDDKTTYSFANTIKGQKALPREYPMSLNDYRITNFDYSDTKYNQHVRGHLIDHQDTLAGRTKFSTYEWYNYVPEPPEYEWGMGARNQIVAELRNQPRGGAYAQFNTYSTNSLITPDDTHVPDDVRLYTYDINNNHNYSSKEVYHVDFTEDIFRPKSVKVLDYARDNLLSSIEAAPVVSAYSPELSDQKLRHRIDASVLKETRIGTQKAPSRFIEKDKLFAACQAADQEFETAGRQLHAGIIAENLQQSKRYLNRAMFFAHQLNDLDDNIEFFSDQEQKEGRHFFKNEGKEMERSADDFRQLCGLKSM